MHRIVRTEAAVAPAVVRIAPRLIAAFVCGRWAANNNRCEPVWSHQQLMKGPNDGLLLLRRPTTLATSQLAMCRHGVLAAYPFPR
jgi:hypothetical protein